MTSPTFVAAWYDKFRDMPVIAGRSILAPMDGDIAALYELRRQVFAQMPAPVSTAPADLIRDQTVHMTGINPDRISWPDPAGAQLDAWRAAR